MLALMGTSACRSARSEERAALSGAPSTLASVSMTDQAGTALSFAEFRGKTVVFSLFFTSCSTICPREARALAEVQRRLPAGLKKRVHFVSLSVDPENDTPEAMRKFALENGADLGSWSFVRASATATRALARELAIFEGPAPAQAAPSSHTTAAYLFDHAGRLRQRYAGSPLDVPRLAQEIERLDAWLSETSRSRRKEAAVEQVTALK
jgi:cytochrome oxidase Cu insertion factor (SCO1/SenC/PrrC family)